MFVGPDVPEEIHGNEEIGAEECLWRQRKKTEVDDDSEQERLGQDDQLADKGHRDAIPGESEAVFATQV